MKPLSFTRGDGWWRNNPSMDGLRVERVCGKWEKVFLGYQLVFLAVPFFRWGNRRYPLPRLGAPRRHHLLRAWFCSVNSKKPTYTIFLNFILPNFILQQFAIIRVEEKLLSSPCSPTVTGRFFARFWVLISRFFLWGNKFSFPALGRPLLPLWPIHKLTQH